MVKIVGVVKCSDFYFQKIGNYEKMMMITALRMGVHAEQDGVVLGPLSSGAVIDFLLYSCD